MESLKWLRDAVGVIFGALLGVGAFYYALRGLALGEVFCLLCKRGSAEVLFDRQPGLFVISELMLLGLGALCLAGVVYGLRDLKRTLSGHTARLGPQGPVPASTGPIRPAAPRQPGDARPDARARSAAAALPPGATARLEPLRRLAPRAKGPWAALLLHALAALCMLATLALAVLALAASRLGSDLGPGAWLSGLLAIGTFFWGSAFLAMSPRPGVSRAGRWLLLALVGAFVVLSLAAGLFGFGSPR